MKYAKTNDCWIAVETNEKINFGEFVIRQYNALLKMKKEQKPFPEDIENPIDAENTINLLMDIVKLHLSDVDIKNKFDIIDRYLNSVFLGNNYFPTTIQNINGEWAIIYNVNETATDENELQAGEIMKEWMVFLDMMEMRKSKYIFKECPECNLLYVDNDKRKKLCSRCSPSYKSNYDKKRASAPKGYRDKVKNYMRNSGSYTNDEILEFTIESDNKINELNNDDFMKWCKNKHDYFKEETKRRKQNI